jgi:hypothetical protein
MGLEVLLGSEQLSLLPAVKQVSSLSESKVLLLDLQMLLVEEEY